MSQHTDRPYSADEVRETRARNQQRNERVARKFELVAICLLFTGLVIAALFPDFRSWIANEPILLMWYSAFVVLDALGIIHYYQRVKRSPK